MPASKHMIVVEKRRDIELQLLISAGADEKARDSHPRRSGKRAREAVRPRGSAALSAGSKP